MSRWEDRETEVELTTSHGELEDVPVSYKARIEREQLEPYSWGASRGWVWCADVRITGATIGALDLDAEQLEALIGPEAMRRLEEQIAEREEQRAAEEAA